jgi:hypothetical protein
MSATEWNNTPWWEQRLLVEGMEQEELVEFSDPPPVDSWEEDPVGATDDSYRALGLTVIDGG